MIENILTAYRFDRKIDADSPWIGDDSVWQLRCVIKGNAELNIESEYLSMTSGQILLVPPHCSVDMRFSENEEVNYSVTSFSVSSDNALKNISKTPITLYGREMEMLIDYFYTACNLFSKDSNENNLLTEYAKSLLKALLLRISMSRSENSQFILPEKTKVSTHSNYQIITNDIKQYLEQVFPNNVTLDEISSHIGVSKNKMMRVFRSDTGKGIMEYFIQMKIDMAVKLIRESDLSFRSISEQLGFLSPEHFSRVFKKYTGLTPTEFSKRHTKWQGCLASLRP